VDGGQDGGIVMLEAPESLHYVGVLSSRNDGGRGWCKAKDTECDDCQLLCELGDPMITYQYTKSPIKLEVELVTPRLGDSS
jgi:hypothetical protein